MIEVEYYYIRNDGKVMSHCANFNNKDKAIRFIYKCIRNPKMVFGSVSCDDIYTQEEIYRRIRK